MKPGIVCWQDLTVSNVEQIRDFYEKVVGWESKPERMGDYDDYNMVSPHSESPATGICHAKGVNTNIPPVWLVYIVVEDIEKSVQMCVEMGGTIIEKPRTVCNSKFCVIQDPAGAICALYQQGTAE